MLDISKKYNATFLCCVLICCTCYGQFHLVLGCSLLVTWTTCSFCDSCTIQTAYVMQVPQNKVVTIKEALEISERKVATLTRSLHSSMKLKGEPNCADTIIAVKEHLMRRSCCRFLRQDMQVCPKL